MPILNTTLPLVSILFGAGITYWLNVRQRRRSAIEDLFTHAIAAVAAADASTNYVSYVAYSQTTMSGEEHDAFVKELGREAALNHVRKMAEARQALAQVIPYRPDLERFYRMPPVEFLERVPELIAELRLGLSGVSPTTVRTARSLLA